jgi:hypothetical protein
MDRHLHQDSPMKTLFLAATLAATLLAAPARAADPELSTDTKRMLAYGTLAVLTGACKVEVTTEQDSRIKTGLSTAAAAQKDLTEAQFTEAMKAVGTQVGQNREQVCAALTPDFIDSSLTDADEGR